MTSTPRATLHLVDPARAIDPLDQGTLKSLFGDPTPGSSLKIPRRSEKFARRMAKLRERGITEADRLEMLQSYGGAAHHQVDGVAAVQIYEWLLPYARIFGLQRQRTKVFGRVHRWWILGRPVARSGRPPMVDARLH